MNRVAVFLRKSRKKLGNLRHLVAPNKVALEGVAVPAREHELLTVVGQNLLGQLRHIVPTVGNVDGQILTVDIGAVRIDNADFVLGDGGVHCSKPDSLIKKSKKKVCVNWCAHPTIGETLSRSRSP